MKLIRLSLVFLVQSSLIISRMNLLTQGQRQCIPGCEEIEVTQVMVGDVDVTEWMAVRGMEDFF